MIPFDAEENEERESEKKANKQKLESIEPLSKRQFGTKK